MENVKSTNNNNDKKEENSIFCVFVILITQIPFAFFLGFNLTALNSLSPAIEVFINESYQHRYEEIPPSSTATLILNLSHSCLLWGSLVGSLLPKLMLGILSRKQLLILVHIINIFSDVLMGPVAKYSNSYECLIIGRFINGISRSLAFTVVLIFVAETTCRRRLGFYQSPVATIQFVSCAIGIGVGHFEALGTPELWMWSLCMPIPLSVVYIICWPWLPESPVYLLKKGKEAEALTTLQKLRTSDVGDEYEVLKEEMKFENENKEVPLLTILRTPHLRFQFFTALIAMNSPQFAGVQAITMYSNAVLLAAGVAKELATYISMGIFLQCLIAFAIAAPLQRRFGTKRVFVGSLFIISTSYALFIISDRLIFGNPDLSWIIIFSTFLLMFGIELGPLFAVLALPSELTTASSRPTVIFYSQCTFWTLGGIISFVFPYTSSAWGSYSLLPFLFLSVALIPFSLIAIPETHKRTTAAIQKSFRKKSMQSASAIFNISFSRSTSEADFESKSKPTTSSVC